MAEQFDRLLYFGTVNGALLNIGDVLIGFLQGLLYIPDTFKNVFLFQCLLVTDRKINQKHANICHSDSNLHILERARCIRIGHEG